MQLKAVSKRTVRNPIHGSNPGVPSQRAFGRIEQRGASTAQRFNSSFGVAQFGVGEAGIFEPVQGAVGKSDALPSGLYFLGFIIVWGALALLLCARLERPRDPKAILPRSVSERGDLNGFGTQWHVPGLGNRESTVKVSWLPWFRRVFPMHGFRAEGFGRRIVKVCADVLQSGVVGPIRCASSFTLNGL